MEDRRESPARSRLRKSKMLKSLATVDADFSADHSGGMLRYHMQLHMDFSLMTFIEYA